MNLLDVASEKFDVHEVVFIAFAFMYYEMRVSKDDVVKLWAQYTKDKLPIELVEDYCLELLSGWTTLPKIFKAQRRSQCGTSKKTLT